MFKLFALATALAFALVSVAPSSAAPAVPAQCAGFAFTKTIVITQAHTYIADAGTLLIIGRPNQPNMITAPWATRACVVGGTANDLISTGRGADVLIGNGGRDYLNGMGGVDQCSGAPSTTFANCEVIF